MKKFLFFLHLILISNSYFLFGLTVDDLLLQKQINDLKNQENIESSHTNRIDFNTDTFADTLKPFGEEKNEPTNFETEYYGYNYFTQFDDRPLWQNQPPLGEYIIGPGDELIIEIWGDTQLKSNHIVDKYGKINIDKIGQINITGVSFKDIREKLIDKFINVYSTLSGNKPTSFLDISLGKLKSVNITFMGEVNNPGIHPLHPFSTIVTSLVQIGGVDYSGSLRGIEVIRNGKIVSTFDFYNYLSSNAVDGNIRLLDGDVVLVPIRNSSIKCVGNIMKPGIYELLPQESLSDLYNYFGGLKSGSKSIIRLHRLSKGSIEAKTHLLNVDLDSTFIINDGDELEAYKIENNKHVVFLYGQVKNPGEYAFDTEKDIRILDILDIAGLLNDKTYLQTIYKNVGEIIRNHPDSDYPQILEFNIDSLIAGDNEQNILLNNWDIILIRENPNYKFPSRVSVLGEVNVPGIYTLQKKKENLDDILVRAGGFTEQAFHDGIQLYRDQSQVALNNFEIVLLDGDSLIVPEHPGVVKIMGEVNRPGLIQYDRKKTFNHYIENAGGFTVNADKYNITVIYANGDVRVSKKFKKPDIGEGATIIVYKKVVSEPFSFTQLSTNLASIITSIATLVLLIAQL